MKCTTCQLNEATIHVMNFGDFCLNCHNEMIACKKAIEIANKILTYVAGEKPLIVPELK
ncbi:MAG: hypothetical protein JJE18_10885 [Eubacteriaceae bacterium]|nr:hypothetical protein [Eubacteriaceae bacterium]